ncbi:OLC1v1030246C1 [Oldenlandia corymbosa var. corymbosa]|uniref:OLC1v1030246C1 n=1 Tax=Oldenlandia corymbosa var. corymbosa TaxID=529605 RepID=A0AAV1CIW2_OLDCO|nr:OLC1v1030246C1 [Oldenlandia corymbosa var. corymbosa]
METGNVFPAVEGGGRVWIQCAYERIHKLCRRCGRVGHTMPICPIEDDRELNRFLYDHFCNDAEVLGLRVHDDDSFKLYTASIRAHRHMPKRRFTRIPESYIQEINVRYMENRVGWVANSFRYELIVAKGSSTPLMLEFQREGGSEETDRHRHQRPQHYGQGSESNRGGTQEEGTSASLRRRRRTEGTGSRKNRGQTRGRTFKDTGLGGGEETDPEFDGGMVDDPLVRLPSDFPVELDEEDFQWNPRPVRFYEEDGQLKEEEVVKINGQTQAFREPSVSWEKFFTTENQRTLSEWWEQDFFISAGRWEEVGEEFNEELNGDNHGGREGGSRGNRGLGEIFGLGFHIQEPLHNCGLQGCDIAEQFTALGARGFNEERK